MIYKTNKKFKKSLYNNLISLNWFLISSLVTSLIFLSFGIRELIDYFFPSSNDYTYDINSIQGLIFEIIQTAIFFPFLEELGFRGWLLHKLAKRWTVKTSIIVSSILFAVIHTQDIMGSFIFGIVMCLLFIKSRTLFVPIISHVVYNLSLVIYSYIDYNNTAISGIAVFIDVILNNYLLLTIISIISLFWVLLFVYKNWPGNNTILPYHQNKRDSAN